MEMLNSMFLLSGELGAFFSGSGGARGRPHWRGAAAAAGAHGAGRWWVGRGGQSTGTGGGGGTMGKGVGSIMS